MSQAFVVDIEATIGQEGFEDDPVTVGVHVDSAGNVTVDNAFIQVALGSFREITWNLTVPPSTTMFFDNPAITMFGEYPEWEVLAAPQGTPPGTTHRVRWHNTDPEKTGRSFFYRIHVVEQTAPNTFIPHSSDPIVRNDPPPAP